MDPRAKLSIGMPVYNGERYLDHTISSILGQTFRDFELIISNNASTDRTEEICRGFESMDPRIKYFQQSRNIGAAANYNFTCDQATGQYFKWAAHDDYLAPTYLEKCVAALDRNPRAVLASSTNLIVDDEERVLEVNRPMTPESTSRRASVRLAARLRQRRCIEVFGVVRTEIMAKSMRHGVYIGSDRVLLAEWAMLGPFEFVDEPLFFNRDHPDRSIRILRSSGSRAQLATWYDPTRANRHLFPTWTAYSEYIRLIGKHVPQRGERLRCYLAVVRSLPRRRANFYLVLEPLMAIDARVFSLARWVGDRLDRSPRARSRAD
jgi:glycosyltransferase involved in cell wall biosynthesis